jgi:hypothetical protein
VSELFPSVARHADRLLVVRSRAEVSSNCRRCVVASRSGC